MQERRRWLRVQAPVSVSYRTIEPPVREEYAISSDISEGGLKFSTFMPLHAGNLLELEVVLPYDSLPVRVRGDVAWVREEDERGVPQFAIGVRFREMSATDRGRLAGYVRRFAAEHDLRREPA